MQVNKHILDLGMKTQDEIEPFYKNRKQDVADASGRCVIISHCCSLSGLLNKDPYQRNYLTHPTTSQTLWGKSKSFLNRRKVYNNVINMYLRLNLCLKQETCRMTK